VRVATLLFGVALNAGAPLIGLSCSLASWPGVGVAPLVVKALMLPLAVGRLAPDGRPALVSAGAGRARSSRSGRPPMSPTLTVTLDDPTPRYEQLARQLVDLIEGGVLVQGGRLRRLRQLAGDLGLAVGAVARTYRELEAAGLVGSRRGGGTRVAVAARKPSARERRARLASPTAAYVTKARALGATDAEITEALRAQPT
jgi:DNA-binding transcriptional regulator YhcF (GntR family)